LPLRRTNIWLYGARIFFKISLYGAQIFGFTAHENKKDLFFALQICGKFPFNGAQKLYLMTVVQFAHYGHLYWRTASGAQNDQKKFLNYGD
jgi:hypothetical protein